MDLKFNVKDFPEHGLTIITPADPSFEAEASYLLQGKDADLRQIIEATKPFSVFVKNVGDLAIVGCSLQWEVMKTDEMPLVRGQSYSTPGVLLGREPMDPALVGHTSLINPKSTRFISLDPEVNQLIIARTKTLRPSTPLTAVEKQEILEHATYLRKTYKSLTKSATNITISIDSAIFADGTFVGLDTNQLIVNTQALVDATYDLARIIERDIKSNASPAIIFDRIESLSKQPKLLPDLKRPTNESYDRLYNQYMQLNIKELLEIRKVSGNGEAIEYTQKPLQTAWPSLRRKP